MNEIESLFTIPGMTYFLNGKLDASILGNVDLTLPFQVSLMISANEFSYAVKDARSILHTWRSASTAITNMTLGRCLEAKTMSSTGVSNLTEHTERVIDK
jgi:hypothetical protein